MSAAAVQFENVASVPKIAIDLEALKNDFEFALITLLTRMEFNRIELHKAIINRDPAEALKITEKLVDGVVDFAQQKQLSHEDENALLASSHVSSFMANSRSIRDQMDGAGLKWLIGMGPRGSSHPEAGAVRHTMMKECLAKLNDILQCHFAWFVSSVENPRRIRPWVESAASFLVDLKFTTEKFPA